MRNTFLMYVFVCSRVFCDEISVIPSLSQPLLLFLNGKVLLLISFCFCAFICILHIPDG